IFMPEETPIEQPQPQPQEEEKKTMGVPVKPKKKCNCKVLFIVGVLLVLAGVGYYVYQRMSVYPMGKIVPEPPQQQEVVTPKETTSTPSTDNDADKTIDAVTEGLIQGIDDITAAEIENDYNEADLNDVFAE
ncbi:hypothetical protein OAL67_01360, partial [bacterium]|nr:hypothetical protein [bacterium]